MENNIVFLKNVRVSFPRLFKTHKNADGMEFKMGATFILNTESNTKEISEIKQLIKQHLTDGNDGKPIPSDKICLKDGNNTGREEYANQLVLSTTAYSPPLVLKSKSNTIFIEEEENNEIYAGCYVNAKVQIWWQNNKYGKRINAKLVAIQFANHGEAFSSSYISKETASQGFDNEPSEFDDAPWDI